MRAGGEALRILLAEDDAVLGDAIFVHLKHGGHAVDWVRDGAAADAALRAQAFDIAVLDLGLPRQSGRDVLRRMRERGGDTPVLIITAADAIADRVAGLDAGADDYLVKPFGAAQLDARIRAVLRRTAGDAGREAAMSIGGLVVDPDARTARLDGSSLDLTPREFDLLCYLAQRAGSVVTKRELLAEVWHQPYGAADKTVDVHLSWLRRKLGETAQEPRFLHTVRGVGVRLEALP